MDQSNRKCDYLCRRLNQKSTCIHLLLSQGQRGHWNLSVRLSNERKDYAVDITQILFECTPVQEKNTLTGSNHTEEM